MSFNPFKQKTREEFTKDILLKADTKKQMQSLEGLAKDLIADERYAKYREAMEVMLGSAIRDLIAYDHPDNNIYSVNVRAMLQKVRDLMAFLDVPVKWLNHIEMQRIAASKPEVKP